MPGSGATSGPTVTTNTDYHVLLETPTVLPTLTVKVPTGDGTTGTSSYGPPGTLGIVSYNWFITEAPTWIAKYSQITPNSPAHLHYLQRVPFGDEQFQRVLHRRISRCLWQRVFSAKLRPILLHGAINLTRGILL